VDNDVDDSIGLIYVNHPSITAIKERVLNKLSISEQLNMIIYSVSLLILMRKRVQVWMAYLLHYLRSQLL
jgi:hypothetical protein